MIIATIKLETPDATLFSAFMADLEKLDELGIVKKKLPTTLAIPKATSSLFALTLASWNSSKDLAIEKELIKQINEITNAEGNKSLMSHGSTKSYLK